MLVDLPGIGQKISKDLHGSGYRAKSRASFLNTIGNCLPNYAVVLMRVYLNFYESL